MFGKPLQIRSLKCFLLPNLLRSARLWNFKVVMVEETIVCFRGTNSKVCEKKFGLISKMLPKNAVYDFLSCGPLWNDVYLLLYSNKVQHFFSNVQIAPIISNWLAKSVCPSVVCKECLTWGEDITLLFLYTHNAFQTYATHYIRYYHYQWCRWENVVEDKRIMGFDYFTE